MYTRYPNRVLQQFAAEVFQFGTFLVISLLLCFSLLVYCLLRVLCMSALFHE